MRLTFRCAPLSAAVLAVVPATAQEADAPVVIRADRLIIGTDAPPC